MNHELNNSLAPIRSLVHSARQVVARPEHAHRLEGIFDTTRGAGDPPDRASSRATPRFARLPQPRRAGGGLGRVPRGRAAAGPLPRSRAALPERPGHFDPAQMQQVLINLLKNAHEAGSAEEDVVVSVQLAADGGAVLRVVDRGRGMDEEVMRRALLPFYSSKPGGTGLGLPLCQGDRRGARRPAALREPARAAGSSSPAGCPALTRRAELDGGPA